jgi:flagellar FliJ protein
MKRFKFTLEALQNYKLTVEKMQKAELRNAQQALRELLDEEQRLLQAYANNERSLERALNENINVTSELNEHDAYFKFLRDALKEIRKRIAKAEEIVAKCLELLVITMKELKTYAKLREEQYQSYLKEVQTEEDKEISDLVSFNAVIEPGEEYV